MVQNLAYGDDPDGNVQTITDTLNSARSQSFGYDDLNRLNAATGVYGSQSYQYDAVGNRSTATIGGVQYIYNPSSTSNQIVSITQTGGARYFYYLPTGQVYSDQRNPSSDYLYSFNGSGRLASANLNASGLATYTYNGLEERAVKIAATPTDFIYDQAGHLIAEANDSSGQTIREYVWRDDTPVAMVVYGGMLGRTATIYDIHADHLNRPQKLTTQSASVVWDGAYDPFGIPAAISGSVTVPLTFPGQYWDSETQLSQNWNRDYDPTIGRYVESDPIGLDGGVNTYLYARENPLRLVDPSGKFSWPAFEQSVGYATDAEVAGLGPEDPAADAAAGTILLIGVFEAALTDTGPASKAAQPTMCTKQCDIQYDRDSEVCRNLRTPGARARCWESASERLAYCIRTGGEVGWPPLIRR